MPGFDFLVIGGDSAIARAIISRIRAEGRSLATTTRRPRNAPVHGEYFLELSPDSDYAQLPHTSTVFLMAAVSDAKAEPSDPSMMRMVNRDQTLRLIDVLSARGARIIFPSTTLVNGNNAGSQVKGITPYGRYKVEVEEALDAFAGRHVILRLGKVVGEGDRLLTGWVRELAAGRNVTPFAGASMSPVSMEHAVEALFRLADGKAAGTFNCTAAEDIGYRQVAEAIAEWVGAGPGLISEIDPDPAIWPVERRGSPNSMDGTGLERKTGLTAPSPMDVIEDFLKRYHPEVHHSKKI